MKFLSASIGFGIISLVIQVTLGSILELGSPGGIPDGHWSSWEFCPPESYIIGLSVRFDESSGSVGTLRFHCSRPLVLSEVQKDSYFDTNVTSKELLEDKWTKPIFCERGVVTGLQLLSTSDQSETNESQDTLFINNVALICSDESLLFFNNEKAVGLWSPSKRCHPQEAVCASQAQIQTIGNKTTLKTLKFDCCGIPHPASTCEATNTLHVIGQCSNPEALVPLTCTVQKSLGLSYSGKDTERSTYEDLGFDDITSAVPLLAAQPHFNLKNGDFDYSKDISWTPKVTSDETITAQPGQKVFLRQVIGFCGLYKIHTPFTQQYIEDISLQNQKKHVQKENDKKFFDVDGMQGDEGWEDDFEDSEEERVKETEIKSTNTDLQTSSDEKPTVENNKGEDEKADDDDWSEETNDEKPEPTKDSTKPKDESKDLVEADDFDDSEEEEKKMETEIKSTNTDFQTSDEKPKVENNKDKDDKSDDDDWSEETNDEKPELTKDSTKPKDESKDLVEADDFDDSEEEEKKMETEIKSTNTDFQTSDEKPKVENNKDKDDKSDDDDWSEETNDEEPQPQPTKDSTKPKDEPEDGDDNSTNEEVVKKLTAIEEPVEDVKIVHSDSTDIDETDEWSSDEKVENKVETTKKTNDEPKSNEHENENIALKKSNSEEEDWSNEEISEVKGVPITQSTQSESNKQNDNNLDVQKDKSEGNDWSNEEKDEVKLVPITQNTKSESKEQNNENLTVEKDKGEENDWSNEDNPEDKVVPIAEKTEAESTDQKNINLAVQQKNSEENDWSNEDNPEDKVVPIAEKTESESTDQKNINLVVQKNSSEENVRDSEEKVEPNVESTTTTQAKLNEQQKDNIQLEKNNSEEDDWSSEGAAEQTGIDRKNSEEQRVEKASVDAVSEPINDDNWSEEAGEDEHTVPTSPGAVVTVENSKTIAQNTKNESQNLLNVLTPPDVEVHEKKTEDWDDEITDLNNKESEELSEKVETRQESLEVDLLNIPTGTKSLNENLKTFSGEDEQGWVDAEHETKDDAPIHIKIPILSPGARNHEMSRDEPLDSFEDDTWMKSEETEDSNLTNLPKNPTAHDSNEHFPDADHLMAEIDAETMGKRAFGTLRAETDQSEDPIIGKSQGFVDLDSLRAGAKELGDQITKDVSALADEAQKVFQEVKEMPIVVEGQKQIEETLKTAVETVIGYNQEEVLKNMKSSDYAVIADEDNMSLLDERVTDTPIQKAGGFIGYIVGGMVLCVVLIVIVIFVIEKRSLKGKEKEDRLKTEYRDDMNPPPEPLLKEQRIDME